MNLNAMRGASSGHEKNAERRPSVLDGQAIFNAQETGRRESGPGASPEQLRALANRRVSESFSTGSEGSY